MLLQTKKAPIELIHLISLKLLNHRLFGTTSLV